MDSGTAEIFSQLVQARRSVRKFTEEPIPETVVRACITLALLAPNSSNLQPWEFHWVRKPEMRAALVQACMNQNAASTAAELIVVVARIDTWRKNARMVLEHWPDPVVPVIVRKYYTQLVPLMYGLGPFGILGPLKRLVSTCIGFFRPMLREACSRGEMRTWAVKSTALAAENLMLAIGAHGYDTCPMEGMDSRRVKKLLGLGRGAVVVMILAAGKGAPGGVYHERMRLPEANFVFEH